ncbi:MAG: KamA family radical SAM protein [bacterium]|nr:KamA family radical SAM protein [bacterium]
MPHSTDFITSIPSLLAYFKTKGIDHTKTHITGIMEHPFPLLIPTYYANLIDWYDPHDPLRKMVLTDNLEKVELPHELDDPIGDVAHSPTPGIVHRHSDRCLLMLTNACAVHCRFCFRKNILDKNAADLGKALSYIRSHTEIWEVIFSGGDPFMLTNHTLQKVVTTLRSMPHVKMIRFHTRTPAVNPQQVTPDLLSILKQSSPCSVVLHVNHPKEVTNEFIESVKNMQQAGVMLLSQTVLLKGVNDDAKILEELFKKLVECGVKPYYLHHLDLTKGTNHFRTSIAKGKEIMQQLRANVSGLCIPEYVIDSPEGYGKIPVFWFNHTSEHTYEATTLDGKKIIIQSNTLTK